jgi:uncharacterized protein (DUF2267 family)
MASQPDGRVTTDELVAIVGRAAGIQPEQAERAMQATLQTLGERIDRGEARRLAAELPEELGPWLATITPAERFDLDEFLRRVAARAQDRGDARRLVHAARG